MATVIYCLRKLFFEAVDTSLHTTFLQMPMGAVVPQLKNNLKFQLNLINRSGDILIKY